MNVIPLTLSEVNSFIENNHRHHKKVVGHRFSLGLLQEEKLVGVCVVGGPVDRKTDYKTVAEVTRLCTDGSKNACSKLYSAAGRVCKEMGFTTIQTFILESESGVSLLASGWTSLGSAGGGQWKHTDGKERRKDQPTERKEKWIKTLNK